MGYWEDRDFLSTVLKKRGPYKPRKILICECGWEGKKAKRIVERRMRTCIRFAPSVEFDFERRVCPRCGGGLKEKE
jgi:hypothetical protein